MKLVGTISILGSAFKRAMDNNSGIFNIFNQFQTGCRA